jgi:hypothetical protein
MDAIAVCDFEESAILEISIKSNTTKLEKGLLTGTFSTYILERLVVLFGMVSSRRCLQFRDQTLPHGSGSSHVLHQTRTRLGTHTCCLFRCAGSIFDMQCISFYKRLSACQTGSSLAATFLPGAELLQYSWTLLLPLLFRNPHVLLVCHDVR